MIARKKQRRARSEIRKLQAKALIDLLVVEVVASTYEDQTLKVRCQKASLQNSVPSRLSIIHCRGLDADIVKVTLYASIPVKVLTHCLLVVALDILEVAEQFALLEKDSLLQWPSQLIQDVLHSILMVHLFQVEVLSLRLGLASQGNIECKTHFTCSHIVAGLKDPCLDLALKLTESTKVALLVLPLRWQWRSTTTPLDTTSWSFGTGPRAFALGVLLLPIIQQLSHHAQQLTICICFHTGIRWTSMAMSLCIRSWNI